MNPAVLLLLSAAAAVVLGNNDADDDSPCLTTQHDCRDNLGLSALFIFNGDYFCCAAGHTMQWRSNSNCTCHRTHQVEACHVGEQACVNAAAFILDGTGNTRCCPPGSSNIQASHTNVNGGQVDSCTCSFQISPGDVLEAANSVIVTNSQVAGEGANVTSVGQRLHQSGQELLGGLRAMRDRIQHAFNDVPGLRHHNDDNDDDDDDDDDNDDHHDGDNNADC